MSACSLPKRGIALNLRPQGILIDIYQQLDTYDSTHFYSIFSCKFMLTEFWSVPGPTPYATTSPTVATTPWPTTATWNTADQPSTVPTAVPTA